ncbi:hypothetical protein EG329_001731 [Mollisiaceae sp. DMI_Dod_QoI]|nr:hypothetical protein EG329_001731 [Helotiales sp. DMI_Dod_QoI]
MAALCSGSNFPNCTTDYIVPDPDIAGIGVIVSFAVADGLTIILTSIAILFLRLEDLDLGSFDLAVHKALKRCGLKPLSTKLTDETIKFWLGILEKVILGLSDTQLLTGMAILIAGYAKCSISSYHSNIVSDLAWFASGTHLSTLQVLRTYLIKHPAIRLFRIALLLAMGGLFFSLLLYQGNRKWYSRPPTPSQCLFADTIGNIGGSPAVWMGFNMFFLILGYSTAILNLFPEYTKSSAPVKFYLRSMRRIKRISRWISKTMVTFPYDIYKWDYINKWDEFARYKTTMIAVLIVLVELTLLPCFLLFITMWAVLFFFSMMIDSYLIEVLFNLGWFGFGMYNLIVDRAKGRSYMSSQDQSTENQWGFGQFVPCFLLLLPIMTMWEAWYEARCEAKEDQEREARALLRIPSRLSIPTTPTRTPELHSPFLSRDDRRRLAEEDRAIDEKLIASLRPPAPTHRRSPSVDSASSAELGFELRMMASRSQERLLLKTDEPRDNAESRSSMEQISTPVIIDLSSVEQVAAEVREESLSERNASRS